MKLLEDLAASAGIPWPIEKGAKDNAELNARMNKLQFAWLSAKNLPCLPIASILPS